MPAAAGENARMWSAPLALRDSPRRASVRSIWPVETLQTGGPSWRLTRRRRDYVAAASGSKTGAQTLGLAGACRRAGASRGAALSEIADARIQPVGRPAAASVQRRPRSLSTNQRPSSRPGLAGRRLSLPLLSSSASAWSFVVVGADSSPLMRGRSAGGELIPGPRVGRRKVHGHAPDRGATPAAEWAGAEGAGK